MIFVFLTMHNNEFYLFVQFLVVSVYDYSGIIFYSTLHKAFASDSDIMAAKPAKIQVNLS